MFPNSPSTSLALVSIVGRQDAIGNKALVIKGSREVVGINKSVTSSEFQTSIMLNVKYDLKVVLQSFLYKGEKYAINKELVYKIERTFVNGQFIELYLTLTDIKLEELRNDES